MSMTIENMHMGDSEEIGPTLSPIQVEYQEYQDSRPEAYYLIHLHSTIHSLTPERAIDLYNKLGAELRTQKDLVENWRGVIIKNPERFG